MISVVVTGDVRYVGGGDSALGSGESEHLVGGGGDTSILSSSRVGCVGEHLAVCCKAGSILGTAWSSLRLPLSG